MLTIAIGVVVAAVVAGWLWFRGRKAGEYRYVKGMAGSRMGAGQAVCLGLVIAGLWAGGVVWVSHWRAGRAMIEVEVKPGETRAISSTEGAVSRSGECYVVMLEGSGVMMTRRLPCARTEIMRTTSTKALVEVFETTQGPDPKYDPRPWLLRVEKAERPGPDRYLLNLRERQAVVGGEAEGGPRVLAEGVIAQREAVAAERARALATGEAARKVGAEAQAAEREAARLAKAAEAEARAEAKRKAAEEAKAQAEAEKAEVRELCEAVLAEAQEDAKAGNLAGAMVLCEQLKGTPGWPQTPELKAGVAAIDKTVAEYVAHQAVEAAAKARWESGIVAQRTAFNARMAAVDRSVNRSGGGTRRDAAAMLRRVVDEHNARAGTAAYSATTPDVPGFVKR